MAVSLTTSGLQLNPAVYTSASGTNYGTPKILMLEETSLGGGSWTRLEFINANYDSEGILIGYSFGPIIRSNVVRCSGGVSSSEYPKISLPRGKEDSLNGDTTNFQWFKFKLSDKYYSTIRDLSGRLYGNIFRWRGSYNFRRKMDMYLFIRKLYHKDLRRRFKPNIFQSKLVSSLFKEVA